MGQCIQLTCEYNFTRQKGRACLVKEPAKVGQWVVVWGHSEWINVVGCSAQVSAGNNDRKPGEGGWRRPCSPCQGVWDLIHQQ